jgi:hypothetical protein
MAVRRRKRNEGGGSGTGGSTATDIMTSLIGVMILVLIGILLTTVITQAVVVLADPNTKEIVSVLESKVDGFPEERAFPHNQDMKEPIYLEVWKDRVIIHPKLKDADVVTQMQLRNKDNELAKRVEEVAANAGDFYFVLVVRPGAAQLGRQLRDVMRNKGVDVGVDLFDSKRVMEHVSQTTENRKKIIEMRKRNPNAGKPLSAAGT